MTFSDKQVEAAARAMNLETCRGLGIDDDWHEMDGDEQAMWLTRARAALDAVSAIPVGEGDGERVSDCACWIGLDKCLDFKGCVGPSRLPSTEPARWGGKDLFAERIWEHLDAYGPMSKARIVEDLSLGECGFALNRMRKAGRVDQDGNGDWRAIAGPAPAPSEPGEGEAWDIDAGGEALYVHFSESLSDDLGVALADEGVSSDTLRACAEACIRAARGERDYRPFDTWPHLEGAADAPPLNRPWPDSARSVPAEANDSSGPLTPKNPCPRSATPVQEEQL